jgi:hypothetical protein
VKAIETTSDDKQFIYKNFARFHQTGLAHVFIDQMIGKHFEAIATKDLHEMVLNMNANAAGITSRVCDIAVESNMKKSFRFVSETPSSLSRC